ncbi:TolC family outer membrane protein [Sulfurovum sp.]|uniref:TolC family outer membrane protein n=1 Tax=Sulfurovum sp. TaxID=1969726 RepID=UPI002867D576|nr:TolC family outer membrane protein [Sulfurovum sp.]
MNIKPLLIPAICLLSISNVQATSLKTVVSNVLDSNPVVMERLKNYNATREEVDIAEAGYYPTLDLQISAGKKYTGRISGDVAEDTYDVFQNSLILRQNLFDGFSTQEQVNYQKMRTLAASYSYLEKANDVTLQSIKVYLDLFKEQELLNNSKVNVDHNEKLYEKVRKAFEAGLTTRSEVSKILSSLSLAKSNMMVQKNRLATAMFNFRRVTGYLISMNDMQKVHFDLTLPRSLEDATMYALEYNPSLLVGKYNIKGAEALYKESSSPFFPKVDFEVSGNYNDNFSEFQGKDDRVQGMFVLSYNLLNGGADEAAKRNKLSKLSQEVEVTNDLKRQVVEGMDLSWGAYELALDQMPFLNSYNQQSADTLKLYSKEYDLGERSLLDLLSAENDLKRAKDELASTKFSLLLSKYRILDAMGLTVASIMGDVEAYYHRVGINTNGERPVQDTLPISYDRDRDGIVSNKDNCANSADKSGVYPFGCDQKFTF